MWGEIAALLRYENLSQEWKLPCSESLKTDEVDCRKTLESNDGLQILTALLTSFLPNVLHHTEQSILIFSKILNKVINHDDVIKFVNVLSYIHMFVTWELHQWIPILKFQRKINEGVLAKFSVDTGSAINTLNLETFEEMVKK